MTIRRARPDEAPALTALALRAKAAWGYSEATLAGWHATLAFSAEKIERQSVWVYEGPGLAETSGASDAIGAGGANTAGAAPMPLAADLLGCIALSPPGAASADWAIDDMWVDPAHHRRGIGGALMRHAIAHATSLGVTRLTIDADPNAEAFYVACGAQRFDVCAAPIAEDANRIRPQLRIDLASHR